MKKPPEITWTKSQKERLNKTVKYFNAKVSRLREKNPNDYSIPNKITRAGIRDQVKTAKDLTRILNQYNRFLRKGAELPSKQNSKVSNWLYKEAQLLKRTRNRFIDKTWKENNIDVKSGNMRRAEMEGWNYDRRDIRKLNQTQTERYIEVLNRKVSDKGKDERSAQYRRNFIKAVNNLELDMDDLTRRRLQMLLNSVSNDELTELFFSSKYIDLGFLYEKPNEIGLQADIILAEFRDILDDIRTKRKAS